MDIFDTSSVLIVLAALFGYINYRVLKMPATTGILTLALGSSLLLMFLDWVIPSWHLRSYLDLFLDGINFNEALLHGMLCFLLFAGSLHVNFSELRANKWIVIFLATVGVLLSTSLVGGAAFGFSALAGIQVPLPACLVFGALISPTDPIAVLGMLKELRSSKELETLIAGESLFNDGVGVVVFLGLTALAGLTADTGMAHPSLNTDAVVLLFFRQVAGGVLLGLGLGFAAYLTLKSINHHQLELLITLGLVMFTYSAAFWLEVSGPIAVVVAGLLIGNHGKRFAMSHETAEHVDAFWGMVDDILNAVLFLLIGLEVFAASQTWTAFWSALAAVPIVLLARLVSVAGPTSALPWKAKTLPGLIPILTWGGLRGGLSIAMALSLPFFPQKQLVLSCTYGVVLFSVLVQGLSMRKVLNFYGIPGKKSRS